MFRGYYLHIHRNLSVHESLTTNCVLIVIDVSLINDNIYVSTTITCKQRVISDSNKPAKKYWKLDWK